MLDYVKKYLNLLEIFTMFDVSGIPFLLIQIDVSFKEKMYI